jgi:hypothetical protein
MIPHNKAGGNLLLCSRQNRTYRRDNQAVALAKFSLAKSQFTKLSSHAWA